MLAQVHVAVAGWVVLVMVGVGHRLMPMFMLSHGATEVPARIAVACLGAHVAGFSAIAVGVVAFLAQAAAFYKHQKKSVLDAGMRPAMVGLGGVGAALALGPIAWARG